MILLRGALATVLAAGVLALASGPAAADHIGHSLPGLEPVGLILAATSVDEMPPEMRRAYILGIQEELAAHDYDPGPADGLLGPQTYKAIRKYQRDAGLPVDGKASKELLDHLKFAQPRITAKPDPEPDPLVLEVQTRLHDLGYHRGALDGLMGGDTRESIRAYRYDAGLPITGAIDGPLLESLRPAAREEAADFAVPESADPAETAGKTAGETVPELVSETPPAAE